MEKEIQRILDEHCDWTPKRIEGLKKELLNLFNVSKSSCNKSCSASDWYEGGKCDENGCYHK